MFAAKCASFWRLMRFDKPIGIALLWYPVAWALWISTSGKPTLSLFTLFLLGSIVMRAAGCVINDMADRHLDAHVARTQQRPLAAGDLTLLESLICFAILIMIALTILIQLPSKCFIVAIFAVLLTTLYPFTKRWFDMPQLILGLAFTSGIPMVFVAVNGGITQVAWLLTALNILWVLAYDTEYAMVDRPDDLVMSMRSSAILFGQYDRLIIAMLQLICHSLWIFIAYLIDLKAIFIVFWLAGFLLFAHQQWLIRQRKPENCFTAFLHNHWYGLCMWVALIVSS